MVMVSMGVDVIVFVMGSCGGGFRCGPDGCDCDYLNSNTSVGCLI